MNASVISFESPYQASVISSQYLRDEHTVIGHSILIDTLSVAAVRLAASLENFVFETLPGAVDFACSLASSTAKRNAFLAQRQCTDEYTPKAYFSCLSAYNSGYLWGIWIDLTQDIEDVKQDIQDMLALSPVAHLEACEEWRIDDYECFESISISPYESLDRLCSLASAIEEHGKPFALYLDYSGEDDIETALKQFQDRYHGEYESELDYTYEYVDSTGMLDSLPDTLRYYFDYKAFARDLFINNLFFLNGCIFSRY